MLLCSRATFNSCFQTERVYGSAFSDQTNHFWILVPIQNYIVLVSSVIPRNLLVDLVTPFLMEVLHFYGRGPHHLLWAGSWAASGKNNKCYT
jgi:hypothetical protein